MFERAEDIIEIIEQRKNRGYGLDHFRDYMASIGNPHLKLKAIHVAGTNGKGSTTNDLRSILQEAGYKTGTFTSPYMITHLDRIRINDEYIREEEFIAISNEFYETWMTWDLSMFEIDMCIACVYFVRQQVDVCVFEVGLGGRLDSTNILMPLISVITNIGMDHMELLGDTPEKIAREKAGIIKEGVPLITAEEKQGCLQVFEEIAKQKHTTCIRIRDIRDIQLCDGIIQFAYGNLNGIRLSNGARYQCRNAALAIEVVQYLNAHDEFQISSVEIMEGLRKAVWIGRFERIQREPLVLLDGAHNGDGIHALCESLKDVHNPIIIFSVLKDKNFEDMLAELQTISDTILVCPLHNDRALDVHELTQRNGIDIHESFESAWTQARNADRPVVITGSLYFISEVRAYFMKDTSL